MGKPNDELRQEQEARIAADTLKPYIDVSLPPPPALLFEDWSASEDEDEAKEESEASSLRISRWDLLRPHWNGAVAMLKDGAGGYAALARLHSRLDEHVARSRAHLSEIRGTYERYEAAVRFLSSESNKYGLRATLLESLGKSLPSVLDIDAAATPKMRWRWYFSFSTTAPTEGKASDDSLPDYALMPTTRADSEDPHFKLSSFAAGLTWEEAIDKLDSRSTNWTDILVEAQLQHEVVEFRNRVIEHVLREFELLGHVDELGPTPEDGRYFALTNRQATLVLEIESLRANDEFEFQSRNQLFEKLADHFKVGRRTLRNEAKSIGIYRSYEGTNVTKGRRKAELEATFEAAAALVHQASRVIRQPVGS